MMMIIIILFFIRFCIPIVCLVSQTGQGGMVAAAHCRNTSVQTHISRINFLQKISSEKTVPAALPWNCSRGRFVLRGTFCATDWYASKCLVWNITSAQRCFVSENGMRKTSGCCGQRWRWRLCEFSALEKINLWWRRTFRNFCLILISPVSPKWNFEVAMASRGGECEYVFFCGEGFVLWIPFRSKAIEKTALIRVLFSCSKRVHICGAVIRECER